MAYSKSGSQVVDMSCRWKYFLSIRTPQSDSGIYTGTKSTSWSTTGSKNSQWREKIRKHQNAASYFSGSKTTLHGGYGHDFCSFRDWRYDNVTNMSYPIEQWVENTGRLIPVYVPSVPAFSSTLDQDARAKLYRSAANAMTAFRSLTFAGELRESLRMIANPTKALRRGVMDYFKTVKKRTRRSKRTSRKRIIRETYLESTYGWAPLISDIKSAGSALNRRLERYAGSYTRVSGHAEQQLWSYQTLGAEQGTLCLKRQAKYDQISSKSVRYQGEVRSVAPDPVRADMRLLGVTWADVALTGWELIPWSFAIDYFTNIGDVLESWSIRDQDFSWLISTTRVKCIHRSIQIIERNDRITSWTGYAPEFGYTRSLTCSPAKGTYKTVVRATPLSGPADLSFRLEIPGVSSRKWLNLAALGSAHRDAVRFVSRR